MDAYPYEAQLLLRLVLAVCCGAVLGYERERHGISAGLRTNLLVCLGSALMMVISKYFYYLAGEDSGTIPLGLDPSRIGAQIVTGVGFLGAGVIIKDRGAIRGLTTAATLWFNAGVGMALGAGMLLIPVSCTLLGVVSLTILKHFQRRIRREAYRVISVTCQETRETLDNLLAFFRSRDLGVENLSLSKVKEGLSTYRFTLRCDWSCLETVSCIRDLAAINCVQKVKMG
ncbi:MgtC/SapB family protein [Solidesulfovibrio sp.]|jgi:putative Mg2+ transporter-C (MgtC) family protein|uniref:MgtC/SapB family protein n=1 Tax=Solidesulfovibrio sp. TaxID=2910990 RepID=UPI000EB9D617|nr:MgtC/SapB family protein [Solidesulfovibrio sp.]MEA5089776.1 MgtC/SapB family protein [Solidesulfovibrio sp.]HCR13745.1 magnesium transporter MgtC [Desulfovibrio sp.]HML62334.1 MgtC/SapB family protein [Solidesulfovibrio sp.]